MSARGRACPQYRALGDDLVELPGVGDRGGPQRVAETGTELDAPGDPRRGRQPKQLPELGKRSGEAARPGLRLSSSFSSVRPSRRRSQNQPGWMWNIGA